VNTESEQRQRSEREPGERVPEQPSGPPGGTGPVDPTKDPDWLEGADETRARPDDDTPETAEPPEAEKLSEKVPEEASGEGDTPLGSTDQHSDAPGPHGTG
jgi:hypothetical protein